MWECFAGIKDKVFHPGGVKGEDEEDEGDGSGNPVQNGVAHVEQHMTTKRIVQRTGSQGKTETVILTEVMKIVDGKEDLISATESKMDQNDDSVSQTANGPVMSTRRLSQLFGKKLKKSLSRTETEETETENKVIAPTKIKELRNQALKTHNEYRKKHGTSKLKSSSKLDEIAQQWAEHLARTRNFRYSDNKSLGENIYFGHKSSGTVTAADAVDNWYSESKHYNFNMPGFGGNTGHFTQMIWKDIKEVGIGIAMTEDGETYVVANYSPAGNVMGQFDTNVKRPK